MPSCFILPSYFKLQTTGKANRHRFYTFSIHVCFSRTFEVLFNQKKEKIMFIYIFKKHIWEYNIPLTQRKDKKFLPILMFLKLSIFFQYNYRINPY